jgi:hypothetical protein
MAKVKKLYCVAPGCKKKADVEVYDYRDKLVGHFCGNCGVRKFSALMKDEHGVPRYASWDGLLPPDTRRPAGGTKPRRS